MRLTIEHRTRYRYSREVMLQPHELIVTPRDSGGLTTVERSLECSPPAEISWTIDVFGNLVAAASFSEPTQELMIVSKAIVDHVAPEWPIYSVSPEAHSYPFTYSLDDVIDLGALAQPDWLTPGGERVGAWARAFVMGLQTDSLSLLKDLNAGVLRDIHYRVRDEEGTQSPAGTLELRSGSCRDIAALFIEAARHLGFGARAVSGYLFDPDQRDEDAGATHAWAEVYLPGAGWIAFDPSHRRMGNSQLIPVAFARSNRQIMPVTGEYIGAAQDFESMDVTVRVRLNP
ncbi:transglutaminase family protein [Novosphingobium sp. P6W]|uniref:transglutaminase family protein n=1 Tax=Novosphingobium sp. P6W TaxID=1609758 RepID=UPI0005C2F653|nr:transglutaminase family protein [Novosphingobium sp. P6W]AXB79118.1 transglutaminase family protein [Novosphingobium sp. P6W]KIS30411.1 transglutaminase [Novosphingobium sp. P6W]